MSEKELSPIDEFDDDDLKMILELDDGTELTCDIIGIFEVKSREYIALLPDGEDDDVLLYRYDEDDDGNPVIDNIDDDAEFEAASEKFDEILDELVSDEE